MALVAVLALAVVVYGRPHAESAPVCGYEVRPAIMPPVPSVNSP